MTTTPFEPGSGAADDGIPAADAGLGAPAPAPGFGVAGEEPDRPEEPTDDDDPEEAGSPGHEGDR